MVILDLEDLSGRRLDAALEYTFAADYVQGRFIYPEAEMKGAASAWTTDPQLILELLNEFISKLVNEVHDEWQATIPSGSTYTGVTAGEAIARAVIAHINNDETDIELPDELVDRYPCEPLE